MSNTAVTILYRDAANYKESDVVVFSGSPTPESIATLRTGLDEGSYLIPEQVGLISPREQFYDKGYSPSPDDHVWCEIEEDEIVTTYRPANDPMERTFGNFADEVFAVEWDEIAAQADLPDPEDEDDEDEDDVA